MFLASLSLPPLDTQEVSNSFLLLSLSLLLVVSQHWSDRRMIVEHEIYIYIFFFPNERYFLFSVAFDIYRNDGNGIIKSIQNFYERRLSLIRLICLNVVIPVVIYVYIYFKRIMYITEMFVKREMFPFPSEVSFHRY